jgi:hypothetical protein
MASARAKCCREQVQQILNNSIGHNGGRAPPFVSEVHPPSHRSGVLSPHGAREMIHFLPAAKQGLIACDDASSSPISGARRSCRARRSRPHDGGLGQPSAPAGGRIGPPARMRRAKGAGTGDRPRKAGGAILVGRGDGAFRLYCGASGGTCSSRRVSARRGICQSSATMRCRDGCRPTTPAARIIGAAPMSRQLRRRRGASGN